MRETRVIAAFAALACASAPTTGRSTTIASALSLEARQAGLGNAKTFALGWLTIVVSSSGDVVAVARHVGSGIRWQEGSTRRCHERRKVESCGNNESPQRSEIVCGGRCQGSSSDALIGDAFNQ